VWAAVFNQDLGKLAAPRSSTAPRRARYVLRRLMIDRTTIAAIAAELGVSWHAVSAIAMACDRRPDRRGRPGSASRNCDDAVAGSVIKDRGPLSGPTH
jgi:hypothetical protein